MPPVAGAWWAYALIGLACGIFSAALGIGCGILIVPILALGFAFPQKLAQGTSLAVMVPMALVGAICYKLSSEIRMDFRIIGLISVGAVAGALVGSVVAAYVPAAVLRKLFAVLMIVAAIRMLAVSGKGKNSESRNGDNGRALQSQDRSERTNNGEPS